MAHTRNTRRGLTPQERAIMDQWDAGLSIRQIALALGISRHRCKLTVIYYDGRSDFRRHREAMQHGSAALLRALQGAEKQTGQQERAA